AKSGKTLAQRKRPLRRAAFSCFGVMLALLLLGRRVLLRSGCSGLRGARLRRQLLHFLGLELLVGFLLTLADLRHELAARLLVLGVVDRLAGESVGEAVKRNREADRLRLGVHGEDHETAA